MVANGYGGRPPLLRICFYCPSGPRDVIDDGIYGRLVKEGDVTGYVDALREPATNNKLTKAYGRKFARSVHKSHRYEVGQQFQSFFSTAFTC